MQRIDLQKQATMLIKQLSTEKLKEAVDYLAELQDNDANNTLPIEFPDEIPETGLGTYIHNLFKQVGGVDLEIPPRDPMREPLVLMNKMPAMIVLDTHITSLANRRHFQMSTIQEITAALQNLSTDELRHIEQAIHNLYQTRDVHIIYDDYYGIWTEQDQISVAVEVFELFDRSDN